MKISVVLATYNGSKYIIEQLDSIRNQTVQPSEMIICDDVSSDDTVSIIKDYIKNNKLEDSWHLYSNSRNLGFGNNFNKACELATGELIFFSDQDDIWKENKIQIMSDYMKKNKQCQVLGTDYEVFSSSDHAPKQPAVIARQMKNDDSVEKLSLKHSNIRLRTLGCCMCIRSDFRDRMKNYWFDGWAQDDRMWRLGMCLNGCDLLHTSLTLHRLHDSNAATYGNYRNLNKRIRLYEDKLNAGIQMGRLVEAFNITDKNVIKQQNKMMSLRIDLLKNSNLLNIFLLLKRVQYYDLKRAYLVDVYLAIKNIRFRKR